MFIISNRSATVAYSFHFTTFYSSTPGRNKKTPTYAEYVERHQKHNMKIFSIF